MGCNTVVRWQTVYCLVSVPPPEVSTSIVLLPQDHDVMTLLGDDASDQSAINTTAQSDSSCDRKGTLGGLTRS